MDVMWPAKVWQPIDTQRIKDWEKVTNLSKTGKLTHADLQSDTGWTQLGTTQNPGATTSIYVKR